MQNNIIKKCWNVVLVSLTLGTVLMTLVALVSTIFYFGLPKINLNFNLSVYFPDIAEIIDGTLMGATSQISLTFVNAILGTSLLVSDLYFRNIKPYKLAASTGIMNLISTPIGGLPMCHGSSSVAAHYKFGARTGLSNILMGMLLILAALFITAEFLALMPLGIARALLLFAGYELSSKFLDTESLYLTLVVAIYYYQCWYWIYYWCCAIPAGKENTFFEYGGFRKCI